MDDIMMSFTILSYLRSSLCVTSASFVHVIYCLIIVFLVTCSTVEHTSQCCPSDLIHRTACMIDYQMTKFSNLKMHYLYQSSIVW